MVFGGSGGTCNNQLSGKIDDPVVLNRRMDMTELLQLAILRVDVNASCNVVAASSFDDSIGKIFVIWFLVLLVNIAVF
jgi:hypothetical protein